MNVPKLGTLIPVSGIASSRYGAIVLCGAILGAITGCGKAYVKPTIEYVDRPAYVRLPPSLLAPCVVPEFRVETNGDLAEAIVVIRGALITCAGQIDGVRKMQP